MRVMDQAGQVGGFCHAFQQQHPPRGDADRGELRQRGGPALMLYPPSVILDELSTFLPLEDGDVVMTGTPSGVGPVTRGARFEGRILNGDTELVRGTWQAI